MNQLDIIAKEMQSLYQEVSSLRWVQYTTGFDFGLTAAENKGKEFKKNPEHFKAIVETLNKETNALEKRKAEILYRSFKDYHLSDKVRKIKDEIDETENSLMSLINKFRRKLDGKEMSSTELGEIMDQSPDDKLRQKVYESSLPLNQLLVDKGFLKLINLRKELAQAAGFNNFVDYALDSEELNADVFKNWSSVCEQRRPQYQQKSKALAEKYLNKTQLSPWDHQYLKKQICGLNQTEVDMTKFYDQISRTFLKFGFDMSQYNLTYDIFPRKNKSEWGYHFTIEMGKDSRILANVSNRFSDYWVLLHETGHGAHYMGLDVEETILNWGVSGIVSEGFANFMGNQCYSKEFLSEVFESQQAEQAFTEFQKLSSVDSFQNYRSIPSILFDQQLYLNDLKNADDIQTLRQSIGNQVLGEEGSDVPWARLIHHTSHPIYLHNYFLGDVMSENMKHEFSKRHQGKSPEKHGLEFGQFWKSELLAPSGREPFLKLYKNVLGKEVSITEYIDGKCLS